MLSSNVDVAVDNSLRYEHALVLRQEWGATNAGTVLLEPMQARVMRFQRRPDAAPSGRAPGS